MVLRTETLPNRFTSANVTVMSAAPLTGGVVGIALARVYLREKSAESGEGGEAERREKEKDGARDRDRTLVTTPHVRGEATPTHANPQT